MQALQIARFGEAPSLIDIDDPRPGPGEVTVDIAACGLNFADLLTIEGKYQEKPLLPHTLGMELAGTVTALGDGVSGLAEGTRVAVYGGGGGLAQAGTFPAARCLPIPTEMDFAQAAAFQIAYGTSHLVLLRRARLQPGETVLVLGAAGGVGLTAVEIAAKLGARVIACARGADKLEIARAAGAHEVIDSDTPDLRAALKSAGGVDVVYDPIGEPLFTPALRACNPEARYIIIGFAGGQVPQIPANILLVKNIDVIGFYWGGYLRFDAKALDDSLADLLTWFERGDLDPHISHRLPLDRAIEGLDLLRARKSTGKIVIEP